MKINNTIQRRTYYTRSNCNKSSSNKNFKGRMLTDPKLSRLGSVSFLTSLAGQGVAFCTGSFTVALGSACLSGIGILAETLGMFVKNGELLKLKKHIDWVKSKNIEEAANFAQQNFKIRNFKVNDLDTANWINEGLTKISNKFQGKTYMPREIKLEPMDWCEYNPDNGGVGALYDRAADGITFNQNAYKGIDKRLKNYLQTTSLFEDDFISVPGTENIDNIYDVLEKYKTNPSLLTNPEKLSL